MASEIYSNDHIALANTAAWHGLGTVIPHTMSPLQALDVAKLNWTVDESSLMSATWVDGVGAADIVEVTTHKSLRRSDDLTVLSTVGCDYCVLQNATLASFAAALSATGNVQVETAGSLFGGRKVFFLLHAGSVDVASKGDIVEQYILLANSHDGSMAVTALATSVRVVCNNTLTRATSGNGIATRWRHTSGLTLKADDIAKAIASFGMAAQAEAREFDALAAKSLTSEEISALWLDVLLALDGPVAFNPATEQQQRRKDKCVAALAHMSSTFDAEAPSYGANAWVAANAATNYIQFARGNLKADARINSDLFGAYADAKRTVMGLALATI
jgi:phage/plasmid-like protein (TIGR03299 family)